MKEEINKSNEEYFQTRDNHRSVYDKYGRQYYERFGKQRLICSICGVSVIKSYLLLHQRTKSCLAAKKTNEIIESIPNYKEVNKLAVDFCKVCFD